MTHAPDSAGRGPDRRDFLTLGLGALFVATVPAVRSLRAPKLVRRTVPIMGTTAEFVLSHRDVAYAHRAIDAALGEVHAVERGMSRFRPDSEIGLANTYAHQAPVPVGQGTYRVLRAALDWSAHTDGRFDPALGRVTGLWDVTHRSEPPTADRLTRYSDARLFERVRLMEARESGAVRFAGGDVALDLGGIAKGFAVDRAVGRLRDWGVSNALVGIGGDLYAMGFRPDGSPWRVGVRDPSRPHRVLTDLEASDQAIATSGDYERAFEHEGRLYHHILDSTTAAPVRTPVRSLTVTAADCLSADAAATALFGTTPVRAPFGPESSIRVLHHVA